MSRGSGVRSRILGTFCGVSSWRARAWSPIALLIVDTIYIKLPYLAAAFFLAALMPGLLLSLHVLLQDVDLGKDDLMQSVGDEDQ